MKTTRYLVAAIAAAVASAACAGWEDTGAPVGKSKTPAQTISVKGGTTQVGPAVKSEAAVPSGWQAPIASKNAKTDDVQHQRPEPVNPPKAPASFEDTTPAYDEYSYPSSFLNASSPEFAFQPGDDLYSPFLDSPVESEHWYRVDYLTDAEADKDGTHSLSSLEIELHFLLSEYRDVLGGDVSLKLNPRFTIFTEDGQYKVLPALLLDVPLEFQWVWRFVNAWSFEFGAKPGIYSDFEAMGFDMFGLPLSACLYYAMIPELSFRAGVEARPGWDRIVMPLVGIAWEPNDIFRLEVGLPQTLIDIRLGRVGLYGKAEWLNSTFNASGKDYHPDEITIDFWRVGAGLSFHFTEEVSAAFELGSIVNRTIEAEGGYGTDELDLDNTFYFGFVIGSQF